jgi:hypothetical protein
MANGEKVAAATAVFSFASTVLMVMGMYILTDIHNKLERLCDTMNGHLITHSAPGHALDKRITRLEESK